MKKQYITIFGLTVAFIVFSAAAFAQHGGMHGGMMHGESVQRPAPGQPGMMGHGMADHMAMMSEMMDDMHRMMVEDRMTEEHHRQMMEMMSKMGQMMEQMAGPHGQHLEEQHSHELDGMRSRLDEMKSELQIGVEKKPGAAQEDHKH